MNKTASQKLIVKVASALLHHHTKNASGTAPDAPVVTQQAPTQSNATPISQDNINDILKHQDYINNIRNNRRYYMKSRPSTYTYHNVKLDPAYTDKMYKRFNGELDDRRFGMLVSQNVNNYNAGKYNKIVDLSHFRRQLPSTIGNPIR